MGNHRSHKDKLKKSKENEIKKETVENDLPVDNVLTTDNIRRILSDDKDIVYRKIYINSRKTLSVDLVYIDGMVDHDILSNTVLKPITQQCILSENYLDAIELIEHGTAYHSMAGSTKNLDECITAIVRGSGVLVFDIDNTAVIFNVTGYEKRAISEPTGESVIKGAKDSFVETYRVNTSLVRRKISSPDLRIKEMTIGKQSNSTVGVVYIKGLTNKQLVEEVIDRLNSIDTDGVVTPGVIQENISDSDFSAFPQAVYTERPDKFCANILEGRVGIIIDGTAIAYIVPGTLNQFVQAPEDYNLNYAVSSMLRFLRYGVAYITLLLPGLYIAVSTFHQEMIPTELAISIAESKEGVPFPAFIEVLFMLLAFEILLEAGLRLPRPVGQAVSIVGALVVGEAAINAKLLSPAVVVVIAAAGISGFTMPNVDFANALRLWRFAVAVGASIAGLFGVVVVMIFLLGHFCEMESFGVPYLSPFVTGEHMDLKDTLFRFPLRFLKRRPESLKPQNLVRKSKGDW